MRVLALGGSGDMGRMAVAALLSSKNVNHITIADKNIEVANKYVALINSERLSAVEINIMEEEKLSNIISKYDIVMNTTGPYYKFGPKILKMTIENKKHYVDICDDWKPTLEMLKMSNLAKKSAITAIIGIGASPGISNLMAVKAASELDEVYEITTGWGLGDTKSGKKIENFINRKRLFDKKNQGKKENKEEERPNAALLHVVYESIGKIPTFKNGKLIEIEALTEAKPMKFPGGGKKMYSCHIGHPEPVTLSRTLKAKSISNIMYLPKKITNELRKYVEQINNKQINENDAVFAIEKELNSTWTYITLFFWLLKRGFKLPPEISVIATGMKDAKKKKIGLGIKYRPYGEILYGMDAVTGVPLAIAVNLIAENKINKKGVLTPEECIDPDIFFERFAKYCRKDASIEDILVKKVVDL